MSLSASLLLSSSLLALVVLFAVTKDRWNWRRILGWTLLLPILLALLAGGGSYLYARWHARWLDQPRPQSEFLGIHLGAAPADVRFAKGEPSQKEDEKAWIYRSFGDIHLVGFKNGHVRAALFLGDESQGSSFPPKFQGFKVGASYEEVQRKLGTPTHISQSTDDLIRTLSYDRLNSVFLFSKSRLRGYGIYDPQQGPIDLSGVAEIGGVTKEP